MPVANTERMQICDGVAIDTQYNNIASISKFGSELEAVRSLTILKNCHNCYDVSHCIDCESCFDCSECVRAAFSAYLSGCYDCVACYHDAEISGKSGWRDVLYPRDKPQMIGPIPVIADIHRAVLEASMQSKARRITRAKVVVNLGKEAGSVLEKQTCTLFAAMSIYRASGFEMSPCRLILDRRESMLDMRRLAAEALRT